MHGFLHITVPLRQQDESRTGKMLTRLQRLSQEGAGWENRLQHNCSWWGDIHDMAPSLEVSYVSISQLYQNLYVQKEKREDASNQRVCSCLNCSFIPKVSCFSDWSPTCYVAENDLEFLILLALLPKCWDCRPAPPSSVYMALARQVPKQLCPQRWIIVLYRSRGREDVRPSCVGVHFLLL